MFEHNHFYLQVWLCGGSVEKVPCSLVAHLYRHTPWSSNGTLVTKNRLRVGAVWLDKYKEAMFHTQKHKMVNCLLVFSTRFDSSPHAYLEY